MHTLTYCITVFVSFHCRWTALMASDSYLKIIDKNNYWLSSMAFDVCTFLLSSTQHVVVTIIIPLTIRCILRIRIRYINNTSTRVYFGCMRIIPTNYRAISRYLTAVVDIRHPTWYLHSNNDHIIQSDSPIELFYKFITMFFFYFIT